MPARPVTIFLSAAEASGDMHAAGLMEALRQRLGEVRFVGVGGPRMAAAGCEPAVEGLDLVSSASMLTGPVLRLGFWMGAVKRLQRAIAEIRPDIHIPVDSPALNWHLAGAAKKAGAKVCYYIAPQVWAWAPWRVKKIKRLTDHVACILPFEENWLRQRGVAASYVGHPLFDHLPPRREPLPDLLDAWAHGKWRVALLAGSRPGEISNHCVALAETAAAIRKRWPGAVCTFAAGQGKAAEIISEMLPVDLKAGVEITEGPAEEVLARSHFAIVVSGTVTLAVAHFGLPMVVFYRVGRPMYNLLGRWLVRMPQFSLVNILAQRKVVPELMPWYGNTSKLISTVLEVMDDVGWLVEVRDVLTELSDSLLLPDGQTASGNTAEIIAGMLGR